MDKKVAIANTPTNQMASPGYSFRSILDSAAINFGVSGVAKLHPFVAAGCYTVLCLERFSHHQDDNKDKHNELDLAEPVDDFIT